MLMKLDILYFALDRFLVGIVVSALMVTVPVFADSKLTPLTDSDQPLAVAYAPMQPVYNATAPIPKSRPDPAFAYSAEQVSITLPKTRPKLVDILPKSTKTIAEMFDQLLI